MAHNDRPVHAALACLIVLHGIMLASLFAGVEPHPPAKVAPFGMAPFLSMVICAAATAMLLGPGTKHGRVAVVLTIMLSLVSFGPHKLIDPAFPQIWPAVLSAWAAIATLAARLFPRSRRA